MIRVGEVLLNIGFVSPPFSSAGNHAVAMIERKRNGIYEDIICFTWLR